MRNRTNWLLPNSYFLIPYTFTEIGREKGDSHK
jgi:hypothetical protein